MFVSFAMLVAFPMFAVKLDDEAGSSARSTLEIDSAGATLEVEATNLTVSVAGAPQCCCDSAEPVGLDYVCYDKRNGEVFTTASTKTNPRGATRTLKHIPMISTTSMCGSKGEAVYEKDDSRLSHEFKPADQKEMSALKNLKDQNVVLEAYVQMVNLWKKYEFPTDAKMIKQMYSKYSSTNMAEEFRDAHVVVNGIVYGPHDTQKSVSDSLHGVPVCTKWQKAAKTFVRGHRPGGRVTGAMNVVKFKPSFDIKEQAWSFATECDDSYTCVEYKIGHACGFEHDDVIFLKAKGRADGKCEEGKKCLSGMFHDKGNCKLTGTCKYYFCDCRNDSDGQCAS